jgi:hypothetical protein
MFDRSLQSVVGIGAAVAVLAITAPLASADPAPLVIPQARAGQQSATEYWKSFLEVHADLPDGRAGLHRTPPGVGGGAR